MIKRWKEFNEISGTELVGPIGPAYGDTRLMNKTISNFDTDVIYCDLDDKFYTIDDFNTLYNEYLKLGGSPLQGFSKENIDEMVFFIKEK